MRTLATTTPLPLAVVGRRDDFVPFVTSSWIQSAERGAAMRVPQKVWSTYEHALITKYWNDPNHTWLFATNPADTNFVYGYLCGLGTDAGPVLHYLYVRRRMRDSAALRFDVAGTLLRTFVSGLRQDRITHTRTTPAWERKLREDEAFCDLAGEWFYNPYLAYYEFLPTTKGLTS